MIISDKMKDFVEKMSIDEDMFVGGNDGIADNVFYHDDKRNIFVMNNHKLAFYCWQKYFNNKSNKKIKIVHIDFHLDNDFIDEKYHNDFICNTNLKYLTRKYVNWVEFIFAFALKNNRNIKVISLVNKREFVGPFEDNEEFEKINFFHEQEKIFFEYLKNEKVDILDIDIDYFIKKHEYKDIFVMWSKEEIDNFFINLFNSIKHPKIITVATSPCCMKEPFGESSLERARYIYKIVEKNLHKYS